MKEDVIIFTENLVFSSSIRYPTIELYKNKVNVIIGAKGCGKSSLLRLLNKSSHKLSGAVYFNGTNVDTLSPVWLRQQVVLVGQTVYLFDTTVAENFDRFYECVGVPALSDEKKKQCLAVCELNDVLNIHINMLTASEKSRVMLAIYLSMSPQVFMLDEPCLEQNQVLSNVIQYCKEHQITVVIVSSNRSLVQLFSENTIELISVSNG